MARYLEIFLVLVFVVRVSCTTTSDVESGRVLKVADPIPTLIVPPTSPTRHQLIWGVGLPLDLNYESIIFGLVFKVQYYLADSLNKLFPSQFPGIGANTNNRRRRAVFWDSATQTKVENYTVDVGVIEEVTLRNQERENAIYDDLLQGSDDAMSRWDLYSVLEGVAKQYNLGERECVLRAICEAAEIPFSVQSGLLGEMIHVVMTPSKTPDQISKHSDNEYLYAEHIGRSNGNCKWIFPNCKGSLLDLFTGIHDPLLYEMYDTLKNRENVI